MHRYKDKYMLIEKRQVQSKVPEPRRWCTKPQIISKIYTISTYKERVLEQPASPLITYMIIYFH